MMASKAFAALAALSLTAACTTSTGEMNRTQTGAMTGALAGGLLGLATGQGNRTPEVLVGAGLGAIAGGAIGAHMDRQAAELRAQLGSNATVVNTGQEITVTMAQDILFATDSYSVRPDLAQMLRSVAQNINSYPMSIVYVTGHTDSTGSESYNQQLSMRRADAVAGVLIGAGVPGNRVQARGMGESQPIASNDTASGRAQNRRVVITIRPS
ncbi:OmpA family protein [Pararhodobacter sp.]|uniref:OmpA family protein n=1 Tax=Pararhodobacter sp. TaxID=2127056 RepID=UPI002AFFDC1C|nr:OmpA family protein [Pararhodobacter sp.]